MIKLNLGCGNDIKKGFQNYDMFPVNNSVKYIDLNCLPLPFDDNSIDFIFMEDVFEHLDVNRFDFMREIYRILKPNGKVKIIVPSNTDSVSHTISYFEQDYFNILDGNRKTVNEKYYDVAFRNVIVKYKRRPFRNMVYKIRNFVGLFIHSCYEFELEK